jgi:hypothetical protein
MNRDIGFFVTGGLLLLACLLKLPALIRVRGRDWLLSSICALLLVGAGVLFTAAQSTIVIVNRVTGVTNIAAPLIYILLTGFSGASIVLVLNWRDGPDAAQTRRLSRITIAVYGTICTLITILFALGDTPVEQRKTFDTYYATTPYIREMIVLYITAHAIASLTVSRLCWRWSGEVQGTLRIGLRVLAVGYLMHYAGYDTAVAAAVAARWAGHNWNFLIGIAYITTQPSALLVSVGFILPLIGHRAEDAIRYAQLATLARAVRPVQGAPSPAPLSIPWWKPSLRLRLTQRQTYISDRLVASRDDFSLRIWDEVRTAALGRKSTEEHATAIADAAMIAAAVDAHAAPERAPEQTPASDNRAEYTSDLADISRALRSGIVRDLRRRKSRPKKEADT